MTDLCPYCGCTPCSRLHACPPWRIEYERLMERFDSAPAGQEVD